MLSTDSLRSRVAVIPQDTSLFDNTILYNLRYGHPEATLEEVSQVVLDCKLATTVAQLTDGLHSSVGERGARLSGGERQKVAIARYVYCCCPLLKL
jgi:ATP-binding cassette subfamily B protein